jgi:DNA-binding GntR family transcriptional regulator
MVRAHPAAALVPTLPLQIAEHLTTAILEEHYPPNERLKEAELALHFGVSRATVREALRILEARHLVRILPQRGAQVTSMSLAEVEDLFEIRISLVGVIARRVASTCDAKTGAGLDALYERLRSSREDWQAYAKASAAAATELAHLSGHDHLVQLLTAFAHQIGRYTRLGLLSEARRKRSIQLWAKLFAAIRDQDAKLAESLNRQLAIENRDAAIRELKARGSPTSNGQ